MRANKQQVNGKKGAYRILSSAGAAALPLVPGLALAGQLIYTPVNPSFGGNPLNGPYLLNSAQAQKSHSMPLDDLPQFDSAVIAQTENTLIFQRGERYYAYNIDTGVLREINFSQFERGAQP